MQEMEKQPLNILCFRDSNTFGTNPSGGRWNYNERWPGILQNKLGHIARIIEEGLGGRITVKEDEVEGDKNGKRHLRVLLHSHRPLDLVIIMLGTNDMKQRFHMSAQDIAKGAEKLGQIVENYPYGEYYPVPKVLLVSPIHIKPGIEHSAYTGFTEDAVEVSYQLGEYYRQAAEKHHWMYLDAATVADASERDRLHMETEDHQALAKAIAKIIRETYSE